MNKTHTQVNMARLLESCGKLSFVCLCIVLFDCCITGGGQYVRIGPLSPRMLFGFLAALLALPAIFRDLKGFLKKPVIGLFLLFLMWLAVCAVRGFAAGNNRHVLLSDIKGFLWLYLVPVAVAVVDSKQRLRTLLTCVIAGAVTQASLIIGIHALCSIDSIWQHYLYQPFIDLLIGTISYVSEGLFRIFTNSSPYMVMGCVLMLFRQLEEEKLRWRYVFGIAVCLNGLLLTFTRSVYGCVFVVVICALLSLAVWYRAQWKKMGRFILAAVCATFLLISCQEFIFDTSYFGFAMQRTFGVVEANSPGAALRNGLDAYLDSRKPPVEEMTWEEAELEYIEQAREEEKIYWQDQYLQKTDNTDDIRSETLAQLYEKMARSPIFGSGLGACVENRETGLDEYFYYDMIMRMGIVGLLFYLAPFAYGVYVSVRRKAFSCTPAAAAVACGMVGFWAVTFFNPWMNAALGIAWYAVFSAATDLNMKESSAKADA